MNASSKAHSASPKRWWLWLPLLGLAGWLALFGDKSPAGNESGLSLPLLRTPSKHAAESANTNATAAGPAADSLAPLVAREKLIAPTPSVEGETKTPSRDLFAVRNWNPPPPPPPPSEKPPAPMAPPLPFAFIGKKLEGAVWEIYLGQGEQTYVVREGQVIEGRYRVDKIEPPTLALTYLPLGQVQALPIGESR